MHRVLCGLAAVAVCLALTSSASAQNLVANPGFETGDFTGWTQSGNTGFTGVDGNPHSGTFAAFFGPVGSLGFLSQSLATTPGSLYRIDSWLSSDGGTPSEFQVMWDGNIIFDQMNIPAHPYTLSTFFQTASTSSTPLKFGFRDDPSFLFFDDVSVTAVPEPSSMVLSVLGLAGLGLVTLRKRAKVA